MKCAIFAIGNEILEGSITDTNSSYIAKILTDYGITIKEIRALPDDLTTLVSTFKEGCKKYDLILTTGGLGPTFDDLTAEAVAKATNRQLIFHENLYNTIVTKLSSRKVKIKDSHKRQAYLPEDSILFDNHKGTAAGFCVKEGTCCIVSLPGIPYEMKFMFENQILPFLIKNFTLKQIYKKDVKFSGIPESDVDSIIRKAVIPQNLNVIINVSRGMIIVRLKSDKKDSIVSFSNYLKKSLEKYYFGEDDDTLESVVVKKLISKNLTVSTAESCTGGLIAKKITDIPKSSNVFKGSIVSYSNEAKIELLDVNENILKNFGAVSEQCCSEMLTGCKKRFNTDIAIAITGIAGPDGGTAQKPVGTVYIGFYFLAEKIIKKFQFNGDRETIRERTANTVFKEILNFLQKV